MATTRREPKTTTRKLALLLAAMALAMALAVLPARADTTFNVDSTNDAPDATPGDEACSTADDECTLRAAIQEANTLSGDDVVGFDPSVEGTITLGGTNLLIGSNLKVEGPGADKLSVDADGLSRVFKVQSGTVEIGGLTMTGGSVISEHGHCFEDYRGGGIFNKGTLTLSHATVSENRAGCLGGGIYNSHEGTLTVSDSTVSGNAASDQSGGGIFNDSEHMTVERSAISENSAGRQGGGISGSGDNSFHSKFTITDSSVSGNTAGFVGGGIHTDYNSASSLTVSDTTINGNTAGFVGGGIFYVTQGGTLTVERSTVSGNEATWRGGGIHSNTPSDSSSSKTTVTNSTVSANTAKDGYGGGLYNGNGLTEIAHSTITDNSAPAGKGGGVASYGDQFTRTEVYSSIVSANSSTDATGTDVDFVQDSTNSFVSEGYNLIGDGNATAAFDKVGDKAGVEEPGLEPLSLNAPGTTKTHALKEGSPALNAGAPGSECPPTDQRGVQRPQQGACEIGSLEMEDTSAPTVERTVPTEDSTTVGPARNIKAFFSEAMDPTTITHKTFKVKKKGSSGALEAELSYSADRKMAVLNPEADLVRGGTYKAVVRTEAKDLSGNSLDQDPGVDGNQRKVWFFKVRP